MADCLGDDFRKNTFRMFIRVDLNSMTYLCELNNCKYLIYSIALQLYSKTFLKSSIFSESGRFPSSCHGIVFKKMIVYGCQQYGIKRTSVTLLVYELEI